MPTDRVEHAIYQNQVFAYEENGRSRRRKRLGNPAGHRHMDSATAPPVMSEAGQENAKAAASESVMADAMALEDVASSPSITVHEQKLYADLASTQIVNLSPGPAIGPAGEYEAGPASQFHEGSDPGRTRPADGRDDAAAKRNSGCAD